MAKKHTIAVVMSLALVLVSVSLVILVVSPKPKEYAQATDLPEEATVQDDLEESAEASSTPTSEDLPLSHLFPAEAPAPERDEIPSVELDPLSMPIELDPLVEGVPAEFEPSISLAGRGLSARQALAHAFGANRASESAVVAALEWLALHQQDNGSWSFQHDQGACSQRCSRPGTLDAPNAASGLALFCFVGAGSSHLDGPHKDNVSQGVAYLLENMVVTGSSADLSDDSAIVSHAICTSVLCMLYGATRDEHLSGPAQMAVNHLCFVQDSESGGWGEEAQQQDNTLLLCWPIMALKYAQIAELKIPPVVISDAMHFLDSVELEGGSRYGYDRPGGEPASTAAGLYCRDYLGWDRAKPVLREGIAFLAETGPADTDMNYNFHATQVLFDYGGTRWETWNQSMRNSLIESQAQHDHEKGSWYFEGTPESEAGGRLYSTAMACAILETYYRRMPLHLNHQEETLSSLAE